MKIKIDSIDGVCERAFSGKMPFDTEVGVPAGCEVVFVRGGQVIDILRAGEHEINRKQGFSLRSSPKESCELYTVSRAKPFDILWGVGGIRSKGKTLGANGSYRVTVDNPQSLLRTFGYVEKIDETEIRRVLKGAVTDAVRENIDAADVSARVKEKLTPTMLYYGLFLESFTLDEIVEVGDVPEREEP